MQQSGHKSHVIFNKYNAAPPKVMLSIVEEFREKEAALRRQESEVRKDFEKDFNDEMKGLWDSEP